MGLALDIFNNDAFSLQSMTKAINDMPHSPMQIGSSGLFEEEGVDTTVFTIEKMGASLSLVPNTARGAPAQAVAGENRRVIPVMTTHLPQRATVMADEVLGKREFGTDNTLETVQSRVNKRLEKMRRNIDATIEYQRVCAIRGKILDADGATEIIDLFQAFGLTQQTMNLALGTSTTKVLEKVRQMKRLGESKLGGLVNSGWHVYCDPAFFDAFSGHASVEKAFDRYQEGQFLRDDKRTGFGFGTGVTWEEYRGQIGSIPFIPAGKAYAVPLGVPDMFMTRFAPANYVETVNTRGLPYYAKQELAPMGVGINMEAQSNPISINTRPDCVIELSL
jgi:hypothetical protein